MTVASALPREEALACTASLMCHLDSALLRSVSLIETALQCETVAAEYSVSGSHGSDRLPVSAGGFTKGCMGVPPHEKRTARTTSQSMTATTKFLKPDSSTKTYNEKKKALTGLARAVRATNRREVLDT